MIDEFDMMMPEQPTMTERQYAYLDLGQLLEDVTGSKLGPHGRSKAAARELRDRCLRYAGECAVEADRANGDDTHPDRVVAPDTGRVMALASLGQLWLGLAAALTHDACAW